MPHSEVARMVSSGQYRVLDNYILLHIVGRGTFGVVRSEFYTDLDTVMGDSQTNIHKVGLLSVSAP